MNNKLPIPTKKKESRVFLNITLHGWVLPKLLTFDFLQWWNIDTRIGMAHFTDNEPGKN